MRSWKKLIASFSGIAALGMASAAGAVTIPVTGNLDCGGGTSCVVSGIGGDPLFDGSVTTGDLLHITFAGNAYFQPILDDPSLTPWEVSIGGHGDTTGTNVGIRIWLSDDAGDPATGTAGLSLNNFLAGFSDGVSFLAVPVLVFDVEIEIGEAVGGGTITRTVTMDDVFITDRADEGPVITFRTGSAAVPEPATLALFGFGLVGLGFLRRRRLNA